MKIKKEDVVRVKGFADLHIVNSISNDKLILNTASGDIIEVSKNDVDCVWSKNKSSKYQTPPKSLLSSTRVN